MATRSVLAVLVTLALAVPFTALSLVLVAAIGKAGELLATLPVSAWPSLAAEFSGRWPELAGMVIGQAALMLILILARRPEPASKDV
jgi:hypothetical protein